MTTNVTTPVLYALGTVTSAFSFLIIVLALGAVTFVRRAEAAARERAAHDVMAPPSVPSVGLSPELTKKISGLA